jgi:hypothetical protein
MLGHTKELVLVVPVSRNMTRLEVTCILFRPDNIDGTKVMCRYFDEQGKSYPAFEVAINDESTKEY